MHYSPDDTKPIMKVMKVSIMDLRHLAQDFKLYGRQKFQL